ncbi:MAG TPA: aspartate aminotransferase family protein [Gemmataceae bacterium]|nr:aspartate aminotransferase family protein [Gemmataceae bacterium]
MDLAQELLAAKNDYLFPCVYHFYRRPPVLVRGEGAHLFDAAGRRYLDCYSGVSVVNAGHCNLAIVEAAIDQLRRLQHTTTIYLTEPILDLARAIAELAPGRLRRSFFCASGSEANEAALLLATLATKRPDCVYLKDGLHGRTKWAMSVTGLDMWRTDPGLLGTAHAVPGPCHPESLSALEGLLRSEQVAAVIAEPIQGNGGIIVPPEPYWVEVRRLCSRYGTLWIADEVQTAWNRTGRWFATEHWGVVPDIVTVAKALGNGFPIAACVTTDEIAASYTRPGAATFGGNLVCCRAALATLTFHRRQRLGERSATLGLRLLGQLRDLQRRHPVIAEVRGRGLMIGVELRDRADESAAALADGVLERMKDAGFLLGKTGPGRNVLTLMPPLVVAQDVLDTAVDALDQVLQTALTP